MRSIVPSREAIRASASDWTEWTTDAVDDWSARTDSNGNVQNVSSIRQQTARTCSVFPGAALDLKWFVIPPPSALLCGEIISAVPGLPASTCDAKPARPEVFREPVRARSPYG